MYIFSELTSPEDVSKTIQSGAKEAGEFVLGIDPGALVFHLVTYVTTVVLTVVGFLVLTKVLIYINHHLSKGYLLKVSAKRRETILTMLDNLIKYVMGCVGIFAVLIALGFDKTTLLASAGAASIIIGLAAQELITDFINGFFTVVEGYYDVGDYIVVNGHTGIVETLGIKSTVLRTDQGEQITIPNSLIEEIVNYNRGDHHLFLTVSTAYEESIERSEEVIKNILLPQIENSPKVSKGAYLGVGMLNSSSVDHKVKITCRPDDRFQVERDVYTETKRIFDREGIEIPYTKVSFINESE